jgi:hypothetical protein
MATKLRPKEEAWLRKIAEDNSIEGTWSMYDVKAALRVAFAAGEASGLEKAALAVIADGQDISILSLGRLAKMIRALASEKGTVKP